MDTSTPDLQSLADRVERLEKQNRLFKRGGLVLLLSAATLIATGQARPTPRTVEAQKFVITDTSGTKRVELVMSSLNFFDSGGRLKSFVSDYSISLHTDGINRVDLTTLDSGPSISLADSQGFKATLAACGESQFFVCS